MPRSAANNFASLAKRRGARVPGSDGARPARGQRKAIDGGAPWICSAQWIYRWRVRAIWVALLVTGAAVPAGMVRVPAGPFEMGGGSQADERPRHRVELGAFLIDRDEVTRGDYALCVAAHRCEAVGAAGLASPANDRLPVTQVSWRDATAYCASVKKRLPTEAEWEKTARGTDGRIYPWGNQPRCDLANFGNFEGEGRCPKNPGRPVAVGSYPADSPYGARDLAGNVWEWVSDRYQATYYRHSPAREPRGPEKGALRVVRGGACCSMFGLPRSGNRLAFPEGYRDADLGFRCARDP